MAQALRRNKPFDYIITGINFVVYSTPSFFLGLLLIMFFAQLLGILPASAPQQHRGRNPGPAQGNGAAGAHQRPGRGGHLLPLHALLHH
ncbi:ABC transporter permease subunit [Arthrobacter sp. JCM 19049]|uniref:ABC transporter permease subunit n=1 Tax=Arthrobacter sp. JCM 19049 TaxID=1460643 RepID=UPI0024368EF0|nr:ABC transporter permease subunit [Arthrobacter sp. JCM 19049]